MKRDYTEIAVILDSSGSMASMGAEAYQGFNDFITTQKEQPGRVRVTLVTFNREVEMHYTRIPLKEVRPLTRSDYTPSGGTALYDAIGMTCKELQRRLTKMAMDERPENVIIAILTDGMENSSQTHNRRSIAKLVKDLGKKGWHFLFLAANQDAVLSGAAVNIDAHSTSDFAASPKGMATAYASISTATTNLRSTGEAGNWAATTGAGQ